MSRPGTTLSTQKLEYDEVIWASETKYGNQFAVKTLSEEIKLLPALGTVTNVTTWPVGVDTGMDADKNRPPYWVFSHQIDPVKGLVITNINVRDTVTSGSVEEVFEKIEFSDLKIFFEDNTSINFDLQAALSSPSDTYVLFTVGENGAGRNIAGSYFAPRDKLYQRGLKLEILTNVLATSGGTCNVKLTFSIAFRGSNNDFDPGGVPVAMIAWPQFSFEWRNEAVTKRVTKFMGSIKISMRNKMHSSHMHHGTPKNENIVGFYADSNSSVSLDDFFPGMTTEARRLYYTNSPGNLSAILRLPLGWAMVFDYVNNCDLLYNRADDSVTQREREITAVYGPDDGAKYSTTRESRFEWIPSPKSPGIHVKKAPRQGMYDNMHNHARMTGLDTKGNVQLHAPFCGHSCVHTHWRWSGVSSWGFITDTDKYKGWGAAGAFTEHDAPKVPPNQKVKVAICRTDANSSNSGNSFSDTHILNPTSLGNLDQLHKMLWYRAEIIRPNAGEEQVAMEQGIGWAFRYSTPSVTLFPRLDISFGGESNGVDGLTDALLDSLPWTGKPTPHQLNAFFEDVVYPHFRYKETQDQVPQGDHNTLYTGGAGTSMEDL